MTRSGVPCQADLYTATVRGGRGGANGKMSSGRHGGGGWDIGGGVGRCSKPRVRKSVCVCLPGKEVTDNTALIFHSFCDLCFEIGPFRTGDGVSGGKTYHSRTAPLSFRRVLGKTNSCLPSFKTNSFYTAVTSS